MLDTAACDGGGKAKEPDLAIKLLFDRGWWLVPCLSPFGVSHVLSCLTVRSILKYCQRMWPISAANFRCVTIHPMPYGRWSSSVCKWRFTSFRPHTFRCPALSICASRPQKPPYSKRKWSIPVGNFRSAVVHAILTGLAFLLYWQRMWRIRWLL